MRYKGAAFWSDELWKKLDNLEELEGLEESGKIKRAFLTPAKVTIDWVDNEGSFGLVARSVDGFHFQGKYADADADKRLDSNFTIDLKLVKALTGEVVLMGNWLNDYNQNEGGLAFRLRPDDEAK